MESNRARNVKRRWRITLWSLLALLLIYVGSYAVLSITGGWVIYESGELRPFGLAMADIYLWQPRYGYCQRFHDVTGGYSLRADGLGTFYAPLILLDQHFVHRTIWFIPADRKPPPPAYQPPPASEFHPFQRNRFHGRNRYQ